jgi:hypothetical protein
MQCGRYAHKPRRGAAPYFHASDPITDGAAIVSYVARLPAPCATTEEWVATRSPDQWKNGLTLDATSSTPNPAMAFAPPRLKASQLLPGSYPLGAVFRSALSDSVLLPSVAFVLLSELCAIQSEARDRLLVELAFGLDILALLELF